MGLFSRKEDTKYIKEFDSSLGEILSLAKKFRELHFSSIELFEKNFSESKTPDDLEKERMLFEKHLDILQKLKFQADLLVDEAFKLVRSETALTEADRMELRKILMSQKEEPTTIAVPAKKAVKKAKKPKKKR